MIVLMLAVTAVFLFIDQITKYLVVSNVEFGDMIYTFSIKDIDIFSITHVRNSGAAWSIFEGKTIMLIAFAAVAVIFVVYLIAAGKFQSKFQVFMLSMIISGGIGNLIDRIKFKEVIDFIKIDLFDFPIFNFADICVVVGAVGFCISYLIVDSIKEKKLKNKALSGDSDNENT